MESFERRLQLIRIAVGVLLPSELHFAARFEFSKQISSVSFVAPAAVDGCSRGLYDGKSGDDGAVVGAYLLTVRLLVIGTGSLCK